MKVLVFAGVAAVVVAFLVAVANRPGDVPLDDQVRQFASTVREDDSYQPPSESERDRFAAAVTTADLDDLSSLGLVVRRGTDNGRPYALITEAPGGKRGWGLYAVDLSRPARIAVQVPHPANDLRTEEIGVELFRRVPGAVLSVAGTHRRAAGGAGDMAHNTDSMFHALASAQARLRQPQVQLHGFNDRTLPLSDVVLSAGAGRPGEQIERAAAALPESLRVCRAWQRDCGPLEGTKNAQGAVAAEHATTFFHVEISRSVRDHPAKWPGLVDALATSVS